MDEYWLQVLEGITAQLSHYIRPTCYKDIHYYIHSPMEARYDPVKMRTFMLYIVYSTVEVSVRFWRSPGRDAVQIYATRLAIPY